MWSNTGVAEWELNHLIVCSSIPLHRRCFSSVPGVCLQPALLCIHACVCHAWAIVGKVGKKVGKRDDRSTAQLLACLPNRKSVCLFTSSKDPRCLSYRTVLCVRAVTFSSCPLQCCRRYAATLIYPPPRFYSVKFSGQTVLGHCCHILHLTWLPLLIRFPSGGIVWALALGALKLALFSMPDTHKHTLAQHTRTLIDDWS